MKQVQRLSISTQVWKSHGQHLEQNEEQAAEPTRQQRPWGQRWLAIATMAMMTGSAIATGLGITAQPAHGVPIRTRNEPTARQFAACSEILTDLGVALPSVVDACGAAAAPKDLAQCVQRISTSTAITSEDALAGCVRVRRPGEVSNCVVDLDNDFGGLFASEIMGYCTRTLVPVTFSNCVQGIANDESPDPMAIMDACVDGGYDAPQVFLPTFQHDR